MLAGDEELEILKYLDEAPQKASPAQSHESSDQEKTEWDLIVDEILQEATPNDYLGFNFDHLDLEEFEHTKLEDIDALFDNLEKEKEMTTECTDNPPRACGRRRLVKIVHDSAVTPRSGTEALETPEDKPQETKSTRPREIPRKRIRRKRKFEEASPGNVVGSGDENNIKDAVRSKRRKAEDDPDDQTTHGPTM